MNLSKKLIKLKVSITQLFFVFSFMWSSYVVKLYGQVAIFSLIIFRYKNHPYQVVNHKIVSYQILNYQNLGHYAPAGNESD